MKKRSPLITLILSVLIIALGTYVYIAYIEPMSRNSRLIENSILLGKENEIIIVKEQAQGDVHSIELQLEGKISSSFSVDFMAGDQLMHTALIKGGDVDFYYVADWYADSIELIFHPKNTTSGELNITTRFISLD